MKSNTAIVVTIVGCFVLMGCSSASGGVSSNADQSDATQTADETDAIEQAMVVLGGGYTYDEVRTVTDAALTSAGEPLSDETHRRAWDSVLTTQRGLEEEGYPSPNSMEVMECIPYSIAARGVGFTEAVAYCSLEVAGIPESEW